MRHVVDDPKSKCDCRECWYMRGWNEALARVREAGIKLPEVLPQLDGTILRPRLSAEQLEGLHELARHDGWYDVHGRLRMFKPLVQFGYAQGNNHGKYKITDDGRERIHQEKHS